jgi:ABC-type antimicrobial peptide transport system permease subunit
LGREIHIPLLSHSRFRVTGVVSDRSPGGLLRANPTVFLPMNVLAGTDFDLIVRAEPWVLREMLSFVRRIESEARIGPVETLEQILRRNAVGESFAQTVAFLFATPALLIAVVGFYSTLRYMTLLRRKEIAVRIALGAAPGRIFWEEAREAYGLGCTGLLAGLLLAACASSVFLGFDPNLGKVSLTSSAMFAPVLAAICVVTATIPPAWEASRITPAALLRAEG